MSPPPNPRPRWARTSLIVGGISLVTIALFSVLTTRVLGIGGTSPSTSGDAARATKDAVIHAGAGALRAGNDGVVLLDAQGNSLGRLTLGIERAGGVNELALSASSATPPAQEMQKIPVSLVGPNAGLAGNTGSTGNMGSVEHVAGVLDLSGGPAAKVSLGGALAGPVVVSVGTGAVCAAMPPAAEPTTPTSVGCVTDTGAFVLGAVVPMPESEKNGWLDRHAPRFVSQGLTIEIGEGAALFVKTLKAAGITVNERHGRVDPIVPDARVIALDAQGRVVGVTSARADGSFTLAAPASATHLFAAVGTTRLGAVVAATEGAVVPVSPLGRLTLRAHDHDTGEPLPVRFVIHGIDGAREPNMGPDFRASGAGSLADAEDGQLSEIVPAGKYRVLVTRGPEYTVDRREIEVKAASDNEVRMTLRRVVDTPHWAGCDFHVHSRGGFDSLVTLEDRVRSLASAGIDFAVPSEHNRIGSYAAVDTVGLTGRLAWVPGVEVTTVDPMRGHFNVFPYALDTTPPYRRTTLDELIRFVRGRLPESVVQVNHPRFDPRIGYFDANHINPRTAEGRNLLPKGFDSIEVFNGFDLGNLEKVEGVLIDWITLLENGRTHWATGSSDSHTVQYAWAGYPRTYVRIDDDHDGGQGPALDTNGVVVGVRAGRSFVTNGPILEMTQGTSIPGDALVVENGKATIHVKVRAAPWIDVRTVDVIVGGKITASRPIAEKVAVVGPPEGTLEAARAAAIRFDEDITVDVPTGARTLLVIVRGERSFEQVLPYSDFKPFAFTNPLLRK